MKQKYSACLLVYKTADVKCKHTFLAVNLIKLKTLHEHYLISISRCVLKLVPIFYDIKTFYKIQIINLETRNIFHKNLTHALT